MNRMDREDGSAAVIYTYIMGLIGMIVVWIILNPEVDAFIGVPQLGILSYSQDLMNSMGWTQTAYNDFMIVFLILWTLAAYIASMRARNTGM